jgi:hypothetical protein
MANIKGCGLRDQTSKCLSRRKTGTGNGSASLPMVEFGGAGGRPTTLGVYLSPFGRLTWEAPCMDQYQADGKNLQKSVSPTITVIGKPSLKIRQ